MSEISPTWTDERVERLKQLWSEGHSASEVAKTLGGITRNAVIGKVHRLKLSGRARPVGPPKEKKSRILAGSRRRSSPTRTFAKNRKKLTQRPASEISPATEALIASDIPAPVGPGVTLMMLNPKMCKWPIGEPEDFGFHFCAHTVRDGYPYCTHHALIAYQPNKPRNRNPGTIRGFYR
tara:strand:- start:2700 stop:3236 length:537 start_codon:yes stop_codon:yes gene_type:complete